MTRDELRPGAVCVHHSARIYTVLHITNIAHLSDDHPETVVYIGINGNVWSRPVSEFIEKFKIAASILA